MSDAAQGLIAPFILMTHAEYNAAAPLSTCAADARKRFPFFEPVTPPRAAQVMVHRGMAMLAPENTRRAVEACIQDFIEWAEVDVRLTKDGKHVIFHDDRLDGKTDGKGPVGALTLDELQKLDAGAWFAPRFKDARLQSLAEVLALAWMGALYVFLKLAKARYMLPGRQ